MPECVDIVTWCFAAFLFPRNSHLLSQKTPRSVRRPVAPADSSILERQGPVWLQWQRFLYLLQHQGWIRWAMLPGPVWILFFIWTFVAWHRIRCYLIFGRPKGLVISRPDLKVMGKLWKFEAFMEFAGSLSALFFFLLVLFYPHGSYPIIKPQHYPWIPVVFASFLYSLNWNPFYFIMFRALISIEREMLIICLAADYRDPFPPSFLILRELPVCSLSLQHVASK